MSFPRLALLVLGLPLLTAACAAPVAVAGASYGADGVSLVDSGKTMTDHFASMVSKGVFEPLEKVQLAENQRVLLRIQPTPAITPKQWLEEIKQLHARMIKEHGVLPDSTPEIAKDRAR